MQSSVLGLLDHHQSSSIVINSIDNWFNWWQFMTIDDDWSLLMTIDPTFGGVILLTLFDSSYSFEVIHFGKAIFWQDQPWISPKAWPGSISLGKYAPPPPISRVSKAQKSFLELQKHKKKLIFSKRLIIDHDHDTCKVRNRYVPRKSSNILCRQFSDFMAWKQCTE